MPGYAVPWSLFELTYPRDVADSSAKRLLPILGAIVAGQWVEAEGGSVIVGLQHPIAVEGKLQPEQGGGGGM
jgi:hypothetical protein